MAVEELFIDRLHVHNRLAGRGAGNPASLKLGLEQALRQVRPRPANLPPQAILVIRRLDSRAAFGLAAGPMQRWRQQLETQIDELAREALRPGRQYIPPQANSVLFADEVELLLWSTRDLLAGRWAWYWDELLPSAAQPGQPAGQRLLAAWLAYPQAVPHTLVALPLPEAAAALSRLNRSELSRLAHSLHDTFALPRGALDAAAPEPHHLPDRPGRTQAAAPWAEWLPVGEIAGLTPPAAYILGLSHTLVRRPQAARGNEFSEQAGRWLEAAAAAAGRSAPRSPAPEPSLSPAIAGPAAGSLEHHALTREPAIGDLAAEPAREAPVDYLTGDGTFTRLGGAVYFINLLVRLGLPAAVPALAGLNPWELLGGLVIGLLGRRADEYAADPLWAILGKLAGLEPDQPWGAALPAPAAFRLPAAWQTLLPPAQWADLQEPAAPDDWPDLAGRLLSPQLAWWVIRLRPFLARLLAHLLGQDDPAAIVESLFHQPATLYVSRTHIDLVQSVEQISLPLRRAGLDQTPGWRPEFGHIITIHFE